MTDADRTTAVDAVPAADTGQATKRPTGGGFTFTKDGCRTEIRVGVLLLLAGIFFWLFLGPSTCMRLSLLGLLAIGIGVPLQALEARKHGRPGYPLRLGLIFTIGGLAMIPDLLYRETVDGPLQLQIMAPLIILAGVWMLAWFPIARQRPLSAGVQA